MIQYDNYIYIYIYIYCGPYELWITINSISLWDTALVLWSLNHCIAHLEVISQSFLSPLHALPPPFYHPIIRVCMCVCFYILKMNLYHWFIKTCHKEWSKDNKSRQDKMHGIVLWFLYIYIYIHISTVTCTWWSCTPFYVSLLTFFTSNN